jgi:FixJ family two-component response regulator
LSRWSALDRDGVETLRYDIDSPPKVVIAESDAALLHAMTFAFESEGYVVHGFRDGASLLAGAPDGVLCFVLSHRLPGMDGLELYDRLRANGQTAPTIVIATQPSKHLRERAAAQDIALVRKPLVDATLADTVRAAIGGRRRQS